MSNIDDETVRAKMRKLCVSTFADVFYEIVNDEAQAKSSSRVSALWLSSSPLGLWSGSVEYRYLNP